MHSSGRRLRQLDVLRAVAVFLVFGNHIGMIPADLPEPLHAAMVHWHRAGWVGVDLFFVLSGFLVSGLLFGEYRRRGAVDIKRFLVRRGMKIYPAFYVFLTVQLVWMVFVLKQSPPLDLVLHEAFFVQNLFGSLFVHTWSLGVEEQFYLSLPILIVLLLRLGRRRDNPFAPIVPIIIFIAVALPALRIMHLFPRMLKMDALLFGVVLSYLHHYHADTFDAFIRRWRWALLFGGILLVSPSLKLPYDDWLIRTLGTTPLYVGFGCILMFALSCKDPARGMADKVTAALATVGRHSYSIYLWHMTVRHALWHEEWRLGEDAAGFAVIMPLYIVGSIALGMGMSRLVEMPVLAVRDRWFPSQSGTPAHEVDGDVQVVSIAPRTTTG
jgi:peptidoglycan/LPS O-acetylase OafA/YrhL